jgi:hypothetical protein
MDKAVLLNRDRLRQVSGRKTKKDILTAFNERMGVYAVGRLTFWYKWPGETRPAPRILQKAVEVYPAEDWRHELAAELMQVGEVRA